jgi:hypothetical protein
VLLVSWPAMSPCLSPLWTLVGSFAFGHWR